MDMNNSLVENKIGIYLFLATSCVVIFHNMIRTNKKAAPVPGFRDPLLVTTSDHKNVGIPSFTPIAETKSASLTQSNTAIDTIPHHDVIVVGLGGHGSSAVAHLAKRNISVLGVERFGRSHAEGSSHGHSRIIRQAYFEDVRYVPLLRRSFELWRELEAENNKILQASQDGAQGGGENLGPQTLLEMTGGLMIGKPDSVVVTGTLASVKEHGLPHEVLSAGQIRQRYPVLVPEEDEIAVHETQAGYLVPELCVTAYQRIAEAHGAVLRFNEKVLGWTTVVVEEGGSHSKQERVRVETSGGGVYTCDRLVLAVGAWAPSLYGEGIPLALHVERRVLYWLEPTGGAENYEKLPIYIWDVGQKGNFYGFPRQSMPGTPEGVKVAMHYADAEVARRLTCTPSSIDREVHAQEIDDMRTILAQKMPTLNGPLVHTATCMYTLTPDEHFLIDSHPSAPNTLLVSACSGHGFKFCSVVGEIVADLVQHGATRHDISLFSFAERKRERKGDLAQPDHQE